MANAAPGSLLADPEALPELSEREVSAFGRTLVVAPHPDDEALGCGGLIAILRAAAIEVAVLVVSDGTGSHPNSRAWPAVRLRALREAESREAMTLLGVPAAAVGFLGLPDGRLPYPGDPDSPGAVEACAAAIQRFAPATVLTTWRRDPHVDHRATWHIVRAAAPALESRPRLLEYPIWLWASADAADLPTPGEVVARKLEITAHLDRKRRAIAAYRSQTTDLIEDDPLGFRLTHEFLAHFQRPYEVFFEGA